MPAPRRPKEHWKALVAEYKQSGLSQRQFANRKGVNHSTFTYWVCRLRKENDAPAFVPVLLNDDLPAQPEPVTIAVEALLSNQVQLRLQAPLAHLKQVIQALSGGKP